MARILIVEDDPDVLSLMEHIILDDGHQVATAETVAIANILLCAQHFDLVICDVNLPDGNGLHIADRANAMGAKALIVTGHGLSLRPGTLSAYEYMLKPVRSGELLAGIARRLAG